MNVATITYWIGRKFSKLWIMAANIYGWLLLVVVISFPVVVIWFVVAAFDFPSSEKITIYSARKTSLPLDGRPDFFPLNPSTYKIRGDQIVSLTEGIVIAYDGCQIFSIKNWKCYDGRTIVVMTGGLYYWRIEDGERWPDESITPLKYYILSCRWDWLDERPQMLVACASRPFFE